VAVQNSGCGGAERRVRVRRRRLGSIWEEGMRKRIVRLSPRYTRSSLTAGAPGLWFAGGKLVPGELKAWCAGSKTTAGIPGT
jgi:hypothetical protein